MRRWCREAVDPASATYYGIVETYSLCKGFLQIAKLQGGVHIQGFFAIRSRSSMVSYSFMLLIHS